MVVPSLIDHRPTHLCGHDGLMFEEVFFGFQCGHDGLVFGEVFLTNFLERDLAKEEQQTSTSC